MASEASCSSSLAPYAQASPPAPPPSSPSTLPTPPLHPQLPLTNSLAERSYFFETLPTPFSSELIRTCPLKIKPSEDPEAKPWISYIPWTKAKLRATVKYFPKVTEDLHRFAEEFNTVFQTCQPCFSDLNQLVHMLVGKGVAQHCMKTANWENPESL